MKWGMKKKYARNQVLQVSTVILSGIQRQGFKAAEFFWKQILNIRHFKKERYVNFISTFSVCRYKLPHCSVPSKITGKQGKLQLFMSEMSSKVTKGIFCRKDYQMSFMKFCVDKRWKKRQQLHDYIFACRPSCPRPPPPKYSSGYIVE